MSKFQVILPSLNGSRTLPWTLQTLHELNDDDITFVLSDNSSTDNTGEIMREFERKDPRFRVVKTDRVRPLNESLEFAMSHATGQYLMILGGDDALYEGCLAVAREALRQHPKALAISSRYSEYLWPQVPEKCGDSRLPPGGLRMSAANTYELRSAREDLRNQALGLIHSPTPVPYQGWISMDVLRRIRQKIGPMFVHYVTDFWFATLAGAEIDDESYVLTGLPLCLAAMSQDSSALTFFEGSESKTADTKLSLDQSTTSTSGLNLMFLTNSVRGYRYEILTLLLEKWQNLPYTKKEVDLNYLCGFWEEWKQRSLAGIEGRSHRTGGTLAQFRAFIDETAGKVGLGGLIKDLDAEYVFGGDNSRLWAKWGTSFQKDHDWAHDICLDTRKLGCKNVYDAAKVVSALVQSSVQVADTYARLASGQRLEGGPSPEWPDLSASGYPRLQGSIDRLIAQKLKPITKQHEALSKTMTKFHKSWRLNDAPWALRTGLRVARFLGRATGSLPK